MYACTFHARVAFDYRISHSVRISCFSSQASRRSASPIRFPVSRLPVSGLRASQIGRLSSTARPGDTVWPNCWLVPINVSSTCRLCASEFMSLICVFYISTLIPSRVNLGITEAYARILRYICTHKYYKFINIIHNKCLKDGDSEII